MPGKLIRRMTAAGPQPGRVYARDLPSLSVSAPDLVQHEGVAVQRHLQARRAAGHQRPGPGAQSGLVRQSDLSDGSVFTLMDRWLVC